MRRKKIKSFTLIEILMYMALASVIVFTISNLLSTILQVRTKNKIILEVEGQGTFLMQTITQAIRSARDVNIPAPGATSTMLNLAMDDTAKNPTIFEPANKIMSIKEGQGTQISLTSSIIEISDITFQNLPTGTGVSDTVKIQFTIKSVSSDPARYELNFQKTFYGSASLRNIP